MNEGAKVETADLSVFIQLSLSYLTSCQRGNAGIRTTNQVTLICDTVIGMGK